MRSTCFWILGFMVTAIFLSGCSPKGEKTKTTQRYSPHKMSDANKAGPPPKAGYVFEEKLRMGPLVIDKWISKETKGMSPSGLGDHIVIVKQGEKEVLRLEEEGSSINFDNLSGKDINNDKNPELIISQHSGGGHCCYSTTVYSIGPTVKTIFEMDTGSASVSFEDLDNDGVMELITAAEYETNNVCTFAFSPVTTAVYRYDAKKGYIPASFHYSQIYKEPIAKTLEEAAKFVGDSSKIPDGETKCHVLGAYANLMFSGQKNMAKDVLEKLYPYLDRESYIPWVEQQVLKNPHFVMQ